MVRTINADARRRLLADAVWRLLRTGGLEAASVRAVADEAGLSPGSVRHFFGTQDELHVFAMEELITRVATRVKETFRAADAGDDPPTPQGARGRVRAALLELLPATDETAADFHAHLQFIVKAAIHPPLAPTAQRGYALMQELYQQCLTFLVQAGAIRADTDVPDAAEKLAVLIDGLLLRRLTAAEQLSVQRMTELLDAHLAGLGATSEVAS